MASWHFTRKKSSKRYVWPKIISKSQIFHPFIHSMIACIAMGIPRPKRLALGQGLLKVRNVAEDGIAGPRHRGPFHGGVQEEPLAVTTGLQGFLQQTDLRGLVPKKGGLEVDKVQCMGHFLQLYIPNIHKNSRYVQINIFQNILDGCQNLSNPGMVPCFNPGSTLVQPTWNFMMAELDAAPCKATTLSGPSVVVAASPGATALNGGAPSSARRTSPWPSASAKAASRAATFDDAERARAENRRTRQSGSVSWVNSRWTPGGTYRSIGEKSVENCFPKLKGTVSQRQKRCRTASFLLVSELYRRQSFQTSGPLGPRYLSWFMVASSPCQCIHQSNQSINVVNVVNLPRSRLRLGIPP